MQIYLTALIKWRGDVGDRLLLLRLLLVVLIIVRVLH
jgi:hypothetical protein